MDPVTIAGLAGSGASFVGGLINNAWSDARTDKQYRRMNEMQDKMNAYNAPVAQMARLRAAGLNPNLVYANGGAVIQSAVGNAPQPAHTTPIDTQGVLQMVQMIVGAMLEKDKIQANKEMQSEQISATKDLQTEKITADKDMQSTQIGATKDLQTEQITANKDLQTERITADKEMQKNQLELNERIEFAKLSESARQADMRNAIDRAHIAVDQYMAKISKYRADTEAMESYSRKALNEQQYRLHESLDELTLSVERGKIREQQIRNGIAEIENFLSRPGDIDKRQLSILYDKYDIAYTQDQLDEIKIVFDRLHGRMRKDSRWNNNEVSSAMSAFWDSMFKPISSIGRLAK